MNKYRDDELVEIFEKMDYYDSEVCAEICDRVGLIEEWTDADGETFESVIDRAIEILKEGL
jgi:hypothetical protein